MEIKVRFLLILGLYAGGRKAERDLV